MGGVMKICRIADNIVSPLGFTTAENFNNVAAGVSRLGAAEGVFDLPEPFCASLFNREEVTALLDRELTGAEALTFFEKLCVYSVRLALENCDVNPSDKGVVFILSTTKGNVDLLEENPTDARCYLSYSARRIAEYFGNTNTPVVVSNACISGVCAQIAGVRELLSGDRSCAIVVGCDLLSKFIVSGFQSFKALSPEPCKPFDRERVGLNLGEAAATIILGVADATDAQSWEYAGSSIHNDANHISGPSRTGEGAYRVLSDILAVVDRDELGFVSVHGTSTPYNDEMESIALHRAGLDDVPVTGLKGYYGHTLGAAGIVETILSMQAADHGTVLATKGYENCGTSYGVSVSPVERDTDRKAFIKILSGFGGSNAGIAYRKGGEG